MILRCALVWLAFAAQCAVVRALVERNGIQDTFTTLDHRAVLLILVLTLFQALALYQLAISSERREGGGARLPLLVTAALMAITAMLVPDPQKDAMAYIGYAKLPSLLSAYAPQKPYPYTAEFAAILNVIPHLPNCDYGPLWVIVNRMLARSAPTIGAAMLAYRVFAAFLLGLIAISLRTLRVPRSINVAVLLNPFVYYYFFVEAHNDLLAIALSLAGMAIAMRRPYIGAAVGGAAGLVKIVLTLPALLVCDRKGGLKRIALQAAIVIGIVVVFSLLIGGHSYVEAMTHRANDLSTGNERIRHMLIGLQVFTGFLAVVATFAWIFTGVTIAPAAFTFHATASVIYPWYLGWGIPYAVRAERAAVPVLCMFAPIAAIIDRHYTLTPAHPWIASDILLVLVIVATVAGVVDRFRTRVPSKLPARAEAG